MRDCLPSKGCIFIKREGGRVWVGKGGGGWVRVGKGGCGWVWEGKGWVGVCG